MKLLLVIIYNTATSLSFYTIHCHCIKTFILYSYSMNVLPILRIMAIICPATGKGRQCILILILSLPVFNVQKMRATLKNWEWPRDEANYKNTSTYICNHQYPAQIFLQTKHVFSYLVLQASQYSSLCTMFFFLLRAAVCLKSIIMIFFFSSQTYVGVQIFFFFSLLETKEKKN